MVHYASGMATNTNTTHTPGTVKGTARVTTTQLVPGMIVRFPGNKRAGRPARTAMITEIRSELRSNGNYSKRARWYVVSFADGKTMDMAPASRHDVTADETGAPIVEPDWHVADAAAQEPRTIAATEPTGPVLTLVLKDHTTQGSLF